MINIVEIITPIISFFSPKSIEPLIPNITKSTPMTPIRLFLPIMFFRTKRFINYPNVFPLIFRIIETYLK